MGHNSASAAYERETETLRRRAMANGQRGVALRVVVIGGRDFDDSGMVQRVLDRLHRGRGIVRLVTSESCKAQRDASLWARGRDVEWIYCASHLLLRQPRHVVVAFEALDSAKRQVLASGLPLWALRRTPSVWERAAQANADASRRSV